MPLKFCLRDRRILRASVRNTKMQPSPAKVEPLLRACSSYFTLFILAGKMRDENYAIVIGSTLRGMRGKNETSLVFLKGLKKCIEFRIHCKATQKRPFIGL